MHDILNIYWLLYTQYQLPSPQPTAATTTLPPLLLPAKISEPHLYSDYSLLTNILNLKFISSSFPASCVNFTQLHTFISMNESLFTCQRSRCLQKRSHLPVCGTNGITFTNICRLIIANRTTSIPINMAYRGPCDGRATCHGAACSTGPQLNWKWIDGRSEYSYPPPLPTEGGRRGQIELLV